MDFGFYEWASPKPFMLYANAFRLWGSFFQEDIRVFLAVLTLRYLLSRRDGTSRIE
jgi:hypothetical protein